MSDNLENGAEKPQRPKLNLKPRDPNAAARLEAERLQAAAKVSKFKSKSNTETDDHTRAGFKRPGNSAKNADNAFMFISAESFWSCQA